MLFKHFGKIPAPVRVWTLLIAVSCFLGFMYVEPPVALAASKSQKVQEWKQRQQSIERQRKQKKQKIQELKQKEYKATKELRTNQYKLESARASLRDQQYRLSLAKNQLDNLESSLVKLNNDQDKLLVEAAKRVRQTYKGERLSLLHMVLSAKDITTFLDNIYYQQRMIQRDKEILDQLKAKTKELIAIRENLKNQKETIISTINTIDGKKKEIAIAVNVNKELVNKLKTDRTAYEAAERELARASQNIGNQIRSLTSTTASAVSYATGAFIRPVYGSISSPYGWRRHPIFRSRKFHTGVDIAGRNRSPIKAANGGKVIYAGWYGGYGKVVIIDHGKSITTLYAHLSSINVNKGQKVSKGTVIGKEGSTGYSTGPHLHFEVRVNGKHTNPMKYIR
jgi:murein DD-endopeptidase MepM/ murein hydrolase activator NlpD